MRRNVPESSMPNHPRELPRVGRSTLRGALQALLACTIGGPAPIGPSQSDMWKSVTSGDRHAAPGLDRCLQEARRKGASLEWALNHVRALRQSVLVIWCAVPSALDPVAAHLSETDVEGEVNRLQARVFASWPKPERADVDRLLTLLELQAERTEGLMLTLGSWQLQHLQQAGATSRVALA